MNPRHGSKETAVHGSTNRGAIVTDSRLLRSASARNCRNQAWLLKNSCFAKTVEILGVVNAQQIGDRRL